MCLSQKVVLVWIVILFTKLVTVLSGAIGTFLWFYKMDLVTLEEFLLDLVICLDLTTNLEVVRVRDLIRIFRRAVDYRSSYTINRCNL